MKRPDVGDQLELAQTDGKRVTVHITEDHGPTRMFGVVDENGEAGMIATHANGSWWWVQKIEQREPWMASLPKRDAWREEG